MKARKVLEVHPRLASRGRPLEIRDEWRDDQDDKKPGQDKPQQKQGKNRPKNRADFL